MCDCADCEQLLQPYLDRELSEAERIEAEEHLDACSYCRTRYRFEEQLRRFVHTAASEPMPAGPKARLASIRTAL
jgi:anti-sigma factor (TIGR02949 family)